MMDGRPASTGKAGDLKVFISHRESVCVECRENLCTHAWIVLAADQGALCLACAELDHLEFLPAGDAALTRRTHKHSTLSAVVLKWSRARKRYERQGILVEEGALDRAQAECLADEDARAARRKRAAERRAELDLRYVAAFARRVRDVFPACPEGREQSIAEHACSRYSGRVGRSSAAKRLDEEAVRLAVMAHVRHTETRYDHLMSQGWNRREARREVRDVVDAVLASWGRA